MSQPSIGHNSEAETPAAAFSKDQIRSIIERVEMIEREIRDHTADRADIYKEAKGNGLDVKALRTIVRMRKMDANDRQEAETILELYMQAMGML